jgi:hypothetical protein
MYDIRYTNEYLTTLIRHEYTSTMLNSQCCKRDAQVPVMLCLTHYLWVPPNLGLSVREYVCVCVCVCAILLRMRMCMRMCICMPIHFLRMSLRLCLCASVNVRLFTYIPVFGFSI